MHGAGTSGTPSVPRAWRAAWSRVRGGLPLLLVAILACGALGGLLRAGVPLPDPLARHAANAMLFHGALMVCALMGTAIAMERAVALQRRWAYVAPLASLLSGALLLAGWVPWAAGFSLLAVSVFVAVSWQVFQRQRAPHTALLVAAAAAWWLGDALWLGQVLRPGQADVSVILPWWFAFLVVTVAAERLEMTRLLRRPPWVQMALLVVLGILAAGALLSLASLRAGGTLYGVALMLVAAWLLRFDIARRTVRSGGLSAYMASCLLLGYVWLGLAGLAWLGSAWGCPGRDLYLHGLGLGFIASMVLGHAPVVLPAVSGISVRFHRGFYLPLVLLHLSLVLRLFGGLVEPALRSVGALLNALALLLFLLTMLASTRRRPASRAPA